MQTLKHKTSRFKDDGIFTAEYNLAVEQLLEIYIDDSPYAVTMRLPGDDINLVAGFCFTEGIIASRDDFVSIKHCEAIANKGRMLVQLNHNRPNSTNSKEGQRWLRCGFCATTWRFQRTCCPF
jgi:FdhD protein